MLKAIYTLCASLLLMVSSHAQSLTVGTVWNLGGAEDGYVLWSTSGSNEIYLVDNCGRLVHEWATTSRPGLATYLTENGEIVRSGIVTDGTFNMGGAGGRVEKLDWDSNILWQIDWSDSLKIQHHDSYPMPNGNILVLTVERKYRTEVVALGRDTAAINQELWFEAVYELQPIGTDSAAIVWEWHTADHLVQDYDSNLPNYAPPETRPERINLNYWGGQATSVDWMHANSVFYDALRDEIVISVKNFEEAWIIDHSTSTAEAAGTTGGNRGKGGDLLYRWGNPQTYNMGTVNDKQFFGQHHTTIIPPGYPGEGNLLAFNNGGNTLDYSTVDEVVLPRDGNGDYLLNNGVFGPDSAHWRYFANPPQDFYSSRVSGAQRLPNGNTLMCSGRNGVFREVNQNQDKMWEYINPTLATGASLTQGDIPALGTNASFRCTRYLPDYPGLAGRDLTPGDRLEFDADTNNCLLDGMEDLVAQGTLEVYPNPSHQQFNLVLTQDELSGNLEVVVFDAMGRQVYSIVPQSTNLQIDAAAWPRGLYTVMTLSSNSIRTGKVLLH